MLARSNMASHELCQLARRWNGEFIPESGALVEEKIDGFRAMYFRGLDGKPRLWTRGGHEIHGVDHILHKMSVIEKHLGCNLFADGEFQVNGTLIDTKAWCEREWKTGGENGTLHLFDAMPEREWRAGGCDMPLEQRKARLVALHDAAETEIALSWEWREGTKGKEPCTPTSVIGHDWTMSAAGVMMLAEQVWERGGEGLVIKDPQSVYRRGRCDGWWKVKRNGER